MRVGYLRNFRGCAMVRDVMMPPKSVGGNSQYENGVNGPGVSLRSTFLRHGYLRYSIAFPRVRTRTSAPPSCSSAAYSSALWPLPITAIFSPLNLAGSQNSDE